MRSSLLASIAVLFMTTGVSFASPVAEAEAIVKEAEGLLASSKTVKNVDEQKRLVVRSLTKFSRAYLIISGRKLMGTAPKLFKKIEKRIEALGETAAVVELRDTIRLEAITAAAEGKLTPAYDKFARLRDLDPRDRTIQYVLTVLGRKMDAK
ncbi:MAG: hypothetical protein VX589_10870 [Myxococcota bacterium]|nr:hypothetical protein [Myxococcota bacterium]